MSWLFSKEAYKKENTGGVINKHRGSHGGVQTAVKTKLSTQSKTKQCSHCKLPAISTIRIGKEVRRLCKKHYEIWKNKQYAYKPTFRKASEL